MSNDLGLDRSGNGNNWTVNNITYADQMVDSPTNNFCTLNPLDTHSASGDSTTLSEGNLKLSADNGTHNISLATFSVSLGKWYWEYKIDGSSLNNQGFGIVIDKSGSDFANNEEIETSANGGYVYLTADDKVAHNGTRSSAFSSGVAVGNIIGIALDMDNGKVWWSVNGTFVSSGNPATGSNPQYTSISGNATPAIRVSNTYINDPVVNFGQDSSFAGNKTAQGNQDGNGIGDFYYAPPTGFLALCTSNLPDVAVVPSENFNPVIYTGDGNTTNAITGVGFQPDFTWIKHRTAAYNHALFDAVRGATKEMASNTTSAEATETTSLKSFNADGFTLGDKGGVNNSTGSANNFISWNWKANGSGSSNTNGDITSTVSANVDAGFSIVSYTGTGSAGATVGHGLNSKPEMIIIKSRSGSAKSWYVYHEGLHASSPEDYRVELNTTNAASSNTTGNSLQGTAPTNSLFTLGNGSWVNENTKTLIAYCFHSVDGYSKVGSYTGNGNADGTFIYTGFRPAWVMIKNVDTSGRHWGIQDIKRSIYNPAINQIDADSSDAAFDSAGRSIDYLSNGFKCRTADSDKNTSGETYIYLAFAESPFKYSNAR